MAGVEVTSPGLGVAGRLVPWSAILEIFVFKEDLYSVDEICLCFRIAEDGSVIRVYEDEDREAYEQVIALLPDPFSRGSDGLVFGGGLSCLCRESDDHLGEQRLDWPFHVEHEALSFLPTLAALHSPG
ncbi:hypothetical protein OKA04_04380 [Luteolibacter flavescens]|uniref:Uncharacterized protein n=1 Tax=Luteolibacter flavescens TaxID=1859460 RepID=A0ABT3FK60_9BACT|nr:hypothetical protein [Luteolibacter flavescens]MCW1883952.1 hypothetical protein [Luteolibacter flavescens]